MSFMQQGIMDEILKIVVTAIAASGLTAIGFFYRERVARRKESASRRRTADVATLGEMRRLLPEETVKGLSEIEPYSGFPKSLVHGFGVFLDMFDHRATVFHDNNLNALAHNGIASIRNFNDGSMQYCIPIGDQYATCPERADYRDKERFAEEAKHVYALALIVHKNFLELYDTARVQLEI
ncbi:hypothetical protein ACWV16_24960 [Achromobacter xylosoxidans]